MVDLESILRKAGKLVLECRRGLVQEKAPGQASTVKERNPPRIRAPQKGFCKGYIRVFEVCACWGGYEGSYPPKAPLDQSRLGKRGIPVDVTDATAHKASTMC